jgi:hypothetical protein
MDAFWLTVKGFDAMTLQIIKGRRTLASVTFSSILTRLGV